MTQDSKEIKKQKTQSEVKADKRAAALRDNLKKRKALSKENAQEKKNK